MGRYSTGYGLGSVVGSLLNALLQGRAEQQQTETLRKILDQQQRKNRGLDDTMGISSGSIPLHTASDQTGTFGNAPFTSPQDTPYIPNSQFPQDTGDGGMLSTLGNALKTAGSYTLEGLTPGNAAAGPLAEQVMQNKDDIRRKQTLRDALQMAQAQSGIRMGERTQINNLPLGPGAREKMTLQGQLRAQEDAANNAAAMARTQAQIGGQKDIAGMPQRMNDLQQFELDYYKQHPEIFGSKVLGKASPLEQLKSQMTDQQWADYIANKAKGKAGPLEQLKANMTDQQWADFIANKSKGKAGTPPALPSNPELSTFQANQAAKLRDAYTKDVKVWQGIQEMSKLAQAVDTTNPNDVHDLIITMVRAANSFDPSAAKGRMTDTELNFIKTARNGPEALQSWWNKHFGTGAEVTNDQVKRIQATLKRMGDVAASTQQKIQSDYAQKVAPYGIPPELVFGGSAPQSPSSSGVNNAASNLSDAELADLLRRRGLDAQVR